MAESAATRPPGDDLRSALPGRDGTPRSDLSPAKVRVDLKSLEREEALPASSPPEDVRTLAVRWDEHGGRYKPWREVCQEMSRHDFQDWADMFDSAPPCVLPLFKNVFGLAEIW